ncbi:MAG: hypothetical protein ACRYFL_15340 [Janthinobacterium lividum]
MAILQLSISNVIKYPLCHFDPKGEILFKASSFYSIKISPNLGITGRKPIPVQNFQSRQKGATQVWWEDKTPGGIGFVLIFWFFLIKQKEQKEGLKSPIK